MFVDRDITASFVFPDNIKKKLLDNFYKTKKILKFYLKL